MGFREITPVLGFGSTPGKCRFRVQVSASGKPRAVLTFPLPVMIEADLNANDKLKLFIGDGPDAGQLRLVKDPKGTLTLNRGSLARTGGSIRLGMFEGLPKTALSPAPVAHKSSPGWLEVTIPSLRAAILAQPMR
jgi:hypothetical protein